MRNSQMYRCGRSRRDGFTLIEVMIALAIFVIGALAIVRIFPPALGVIQNSENRSIATNMSRELLAKYEADPGLVPDAIYEASDYNYSASAFIGNLILNQALPEDGRPGNPTFNDSGLGHFKRILGEKQKLNVIGTTRYFLTQFPYDNASSVNVFVEDEIEGAVIDANGVINFSSAKLASNGRAFNGAEYSAAPTGPRNQIPSEWGTETIFYADYSWLDGTQVMGVVGEPVVQTGTSTPVLNVKAGTAAVAGPIRLRVKRRVFYTNPPNAQDGANDSMRGIVRPLGVVAYADIAPDMDSLANLYGHFSINYTVRDWRWLVEDRAVDSDGVLKVPTRYIDNEILASTTQTVPNVGGPASVFTLLETSGALELARWDGVNQSGSGLVADDAPRKDPIDAKEGRIKFQGAGKARAVYFTTDQWARQLSVAAKSYTPWWGNAATNTPREEWREYVWEPTNSGTMYFRASEVGKTVIVDFDYNDGVTDRRKTVPLVIDDETQVPPTSATAFAPRVAVLRFSDSSAGGGTYNVVAIHSVRGASVMARAAWASDGRYQQEVATTYRRLDGNS